MEVANNKRAEINEIKNLNVNETKSWLFEKVNKINKPPARLTKIQLRNIKIWKKDYCYNHVDIKKIEY